MSSGIINFTNVESAGKRIPLRGCLGSAGLLTCLSGIVWSAYTDRGDLAWKQAAWSLLWPCSKIQKNWASDVHELISLCSWPSVMCLSEDPATLTSLLWWTVTWNYELRQTPPMFCQFITTKMKLGQKQIERMWACCCDTPDHVTVKLWNCQRKAEPFGMLDRKP